LVSCDDPGGLYDITGGESRYITRITNIPCIEPAGPQEAKDMTKWAFKLSEELRTVIFLRITTGVSHTTENVTCEEFPDTPKTAHLDFGNYIRGQSSDVIMAGSASTRHETTWKRILRARELFEESSFNHYTGPENPELLIITCGVCHLYSEEAVRILDIQDRVGLLKIGTTWPLPHKLIRRCLLSTDKVMIVEEGLPFLEENVKIAAAEMAGDIGCKTFYNKRGKDVPPTGAMGPDFVIDELSRILGLHYRAIPHGYRERASTLLPDDTKREETFCPGCPHRASYWSIRKALQLDGRDGFVCGDIGCYSMATTSCGFNTIKTLHAMGSGMGVANGFGKLGQFGMGKPILAVSGDSTFFHSVMPALANAIHHDSDVTLIVLDNGGAAMSGFQPHPGLGHEALGEKARSIDIARVCESMGAHVEISDPFDLDTTQRFLNRLMEEKGTTVLVLRQACALSPERREKKNYNMTVDATLCWGEACGCNCLCTRVFRCPALVWDADQRSARIDGGICAGCGVCADICPQGAIIREEVI